MPLIFILPGEVFGCPRGFSCGVIFGTWWFWVFLGGLIGDIHVAPFKSDAFVFLRGAKPSYKVRATLRGAKPGTRAIGGDSRQFDTTKSSEMQFVGVPECLPPVRYVDRCETISLAEAWSAAPRSEILHSARFVWTLENRR